MKYILLLLIIIVLLIYNIKKNNVSNIESYTELVNKSHLSSKVHRPSNTILKSTENYYKMIDDLILPDSVKDEFNEWIEKGLVSPVKDQMKCGGCWAFSTCSTITDRINIATNNKWDSKYGLSEQMLISCNQSGCAGGLPSEAIEYLNNNKIYLDQYCENCGNINTNNNDNDSGGIVNNPITCTNSTGDSHTKYTWWQTGCSEFSNCNIDRSQTCSCKDIEQKFSKYTNKSKYGTIGNAHRYCKHGDDDKPLEVDLWPTISSKLMKENVIRMKKAIYHNGPIIVGYKVYQDFYNTWGNSSSDNYYKYDGTSPEVGGHSVVIVGWKKVNGIPVWIVKNSWGENGGYGFPDGPRWINPLTGKYELKYKGGFWNHIMGENDSFIESNATGAHPDLSNTTIKKYISIDNINNWYKNYTLRQIYNKTKQKHVPIPHTKKKSVIKSEYYSDINNLKSTQFNELDLSKILNNNIIISSDNEDNINKILNILKGDMLFNESQVNDIANSIINNIDGFYLLALKGYFNNYYYLYGNTKYMKNYKDYINISATTTKISYDLYLILKNNIKNNFIVYLKK